MTHETELEQLPEPIAHAKKLLGELMSALQGDSEGFSVEFTLGEDSYMNSVRKRFMGEIGLRHKYDLSSHDDSEPWRVLDFGPMSLVQTVVELANDPGYVRYELVPNVRVVT